MLYKVSEDPYTRVPSIVYDIVGPLLSPAERDCLYYIVRRTWGFPDANGAPRARGTIAIEQFENGISSGDTLLDLGTQLSRGTIKKALLSLKEAGLVETKMSCPECLWEEERGSFEDNECPRCGSQLKEAWTLGELTPRKICKILNERDRHKREWTWNKKQRRFHFSNPEEELKKKESQKELEKEIAELKESVWYPDLVQKAIEQANSALAGNKKVTLSRELKSFWRPVYSLQQKHESAPLVKYALEKTIDARVAAQPKNYRWYRYMEVVAKNSSHKFGGEDIKNHGTDDSLRQKEKKMRDLLRQAAMLNGSGEAEEARALLSDIISQSEELSPLFAGDALLTENSLREAFKQGSSDFVGIEPDPYGLDFYPEWSWS